jgi:hypothetical protein
MVLLFMGVKGLKFNLLLLLLVVGLNLNVPENKEEPFHCR